ncbi:MAG: alpha/beta hydrolase family esterase [Aurantibacter sp.]
MELNVVKRLLIAILLIGLFMSCSKSDDAVAANMGLFTKETIMVNGSARTYDYYVPDGLSSASPMIFLLHGGGSSSDDLTGESGLKAPYSIWMDIADDEKFIVVFPNGEINPLGGQGWNDCRADATTNPSVDDVGFIDTLIDHFINSLSVDPNRIYASGTSNGGHMSLRLALELSDKIAAVAPVVASMPAMSCSAPADPISILFMNGTQDPLLPYNGGEVAPSIGGRGTVLSAQESVDFWVNFNQIDPIPVELSFQDTNTMDNSTVKKITYSGGLEGTQVVLYEVLGGGHVEPSLAEQYSAVLEMVLGYQNHEIEMAAEIWEFFKNKTLH